MEWLQNYAAIFIAISLAMFIATLIVVPVIVVRIPADYFAYSGVEHLFLARINPIARIVLLVIKNVLGFVLILVGITLLVLPGQGLLTIFVGVMLLNFPHKHRFLRWFLARPPISRPVNWLRQKAGQAPLQLN